MAKVKLKLEPQNMSLYQMKVLLCTLLKDKEINETDVPNSVKKHFKKITQ